jgi:hypothetical protein
VEQQWAPGWRISDWSDFELLDLAPPSKKRLKLLVLVSKQVVSNTIAEGASRLHFIWRSSNAIDRLLGNATIQGTGTKEEKRRQMKDQKKRESIACKQPPV